MNRVKCSTIRDRVRRKFVALLRTALIGVAILGSSRSSAWAQLSADQTWEYSPYQVHVWVACAEAPELVPLPYPSLVGSLAHDLESVVGRSWNVQASVCPEMVYPDVISDLERVTASQVIAASEDVLDADKLFLVAVDADHAGFEIRTREWCVRTRTWGPIVSRPFVQRELLGTETLRSILDAFAPIVRIDDARSRSANVRVRAGGLIVHDDAPTAIHAGDVLQPVIRRNDRFGQPLENGVETVSWTFLEVQDAGERAVACDMHSAMRNPLGVRTSVRTQRLALRVRVTSGETALRLFSEEDPPRPLAGYEVLSKVPTRADAAAEGGAASDKPSEDDDQSNVTLIGRTDWRGQLTIPRGDRKLLLLYVKNGSRLLARLPMVPGLYVEQSVQLNNDDQRMRAEALLAGFRNQLMDLVARREVMTAQFRARISEKKLEEARALLAELRKLDVDLQMQRQLTQQQQRFSTSDPAVQARIDQMFANTFQLIDKYLGNNLINRLTSELAAAQDKQ